MKHKLKPAISKTPLSEHSEAFAALQQALLATETVARQIAAEKVAETHEPTCTQPTLALCRMVEGISVEEWNKLAEKNNLQHWLAVPLLTDCDGKALLALQNMVDELSYQRNHDPLTKLANRRFFDITLAAEINRSRRTGTDLALAMIDLDGLKKINDSYGHICGDKVLTMLAKHLRGAARSYDLVARLGGDEFAIILPGINAWGAEKILDRIRKKIETEIFSCVEGTNFHITFSAGVTAINRTMQNNPTIEQILQAADKALYAAKGTSKNCVYHGESEAILKNSTLLQSAEKRFLLSGKE